MAQYFDFPVKIPASDDAIADVIKAAWSHSDPLVAVATRNKKLWVAQEEVGGRLLAGIGPPPHQACVCRQPTLRARAHGRTGLSSVPLPSRWCGGHSWSVAEK